MNRTIDHAGISLVEAVVVVTILAILAAFAVPRFTQMEAESRAAAVTALAGSVRSGAALAHALWLASGQPASVPMAGVPPPGIAIVNGYPGVAMVDDTVADLTGFTYDPAEGVFQRDDVTGSCGVTYAQAQANGAPMITATTTGC